MDVGEDIRMDVRTLGDEVLDGKRVSLKEALWLYRQPLEELCDKADEIRKSLCSNRFDMCTIINGKAGDVQKIAVFVRSRLTIILARQNIRCWEQRRLWSRPV